MVDGVVRLLRDLLVVLMMPDIPYPVAMALLLCYAVL